MRIKENIELFYNNGYVQFAQMLAPIALRIVLNKYVGRNLSSGMSIIIPLSLWIEMSSNVPAIDKSSLQYVWNPIRYQLTSCLLYSCFSVLGYNFYITKFAAKMVATLIFGSPIQQHILGVPEKRYDFRYAIQTIIADTSDLMLGCVNAYSVVGDNVIMQRLVSFISRFVMSAGAARIIGNDTANSGVIENAKRRSGTVVAELIMGLMHIEGCANIVKYASGEMVHSFVNSYVEAFTDFGLGVG